MRDIWKSKVRRSEIQHEGVVDAQFCVQSSMCQFHVTLTSLRWYKKGSELNSFRQRTKFTWESCRMWDFLWKNALNRTNCKCVITNGFLKLAFPSCICNSLCTVGHKGTQEQFTKQSCTSNFSTFSLAKKKGAQPLQSHQQMLHHPTSPVVGKDKVKGEKNKDLKLRQKEKEKHKKWIEKQVKIGISAKDDRGCFHSSVTRELQYKGLVCKCEGAFTKHSFHKKKDCEYKAERYLREQKEQLSVVRYVFSF